MRIGREGGFIQKPLSLDTLTKGNETKAVPYITKIININVVIIGKRRGERM
jgi:hypothetical protein